MEGGNLLREVDMTVENGAHQQIPKGYLAVHAHFNFAFNSLGTHSSGALFSKSSNACKNWWM